MIGRLDGIKILVTREEEKAWETAAEIEERGGIPYVFPMIETRQLDNLEALEGALRRLDSFSSIVVQSRKGVEVLLNKAKEIGVDIGKWGGRVFAVGEKTREALSDFDINNCLVPSREDAEGLVSLLKQEGGRRVIVVRAKEGSDVVVRELSREGVEVVDCVAYETSCRNPSEDEVQMLIEGRRPDVAMFLSPSAFRCLISCLGAECAKTFLGGVKIAVIGGTTASEVIKRGYEVHIKAIKPTVGSLLDAISSYFPRV
jgi:uroporphyrinogen-III synthase